MSDFNLNDAKEQLRNYRDIYGGHIDLTSINNAKSIFDIENLINNHSDSLSKIEQEAQNNLNEFKRSIGAF